MPSTQPPRSGSDLPARCSMKRGCHPTGGDRGPETSRPTSSLVPPHQLAEHADEDRREREGERDDENAHRCRVTDVIPVEDLLVDQPRQVRRGRSPWVVIAITSNSARM